MVKNIFKGVRQVTMENFNSITDKKGFLWFVRETITKLEGSSSPFEENRYHIYFGNTKYGDYWGGEYEAISTLIDAINQQSNIIANKQDIINDLESIRNGALLGSTALQSYTEQYTGTYNKPNGGIPKTDLSSDVQISLEKANSALQSIPTEYAKLVDVEQMIADSITTALNTEV